MQYNKQVNISEFEWLLIQEVRKLQQVGYGDISLKCVAGIFVDMRTGYTKDSSALKRLQAQVYNTDTIAEDVRLGNCAYANIKSEEYCTGSIGLK